MAFRYIFLVGLAVAATSCADQKGSFPSLAKRPIETRSDAVATTATTTPVKAQVDAGQLEQLETYLQAARAADGRFSSTLLSVETAVARARGAAFGSDPWIEAQTQVSVLERDRLLAQNALADALNAQRAIVEANPQADLAPVTKIMAQIEEIDARQERIVAGLLSQLSR